MPRDLDVNVYVGIKGSVVALDRATGAQRWQAKLKGSGFVALHRDDRHLYATASGEIFCLDPATGTVVWHNPLKGMGLGLASMLSDAAYLAGQTESSTTYVSVAEEMRRRQAAQAASATT